MIRSIGFICLVLFASSAFSQNVGQEGDTLLNYKDINGLRQGKWEKKYTNGKIKYTAFFVNDKPVGDLKRYDIKGFITAHLIYDQKGEKASAVFFHRTGDTAGTGGYIGQIKDGVWKYYSNRGVFYMQESFKKGVKHGKFLNITTEGVIMEELNYVDGIKHGPWIKHYAEGPLMWKANFVHGKLEGLAKAYYKNGKLYREGKFINDLMEGPWKQYSESGNLKKVYQYKKGHSPEAEAEEQEMFKEFDLNKGTMPGPKNNNDLDWLRGSGRGY